MASADTAEQPETKSIRDLTLAEVATSPRILMVIGLLVAVAVAALVVFFIQPGDGSSPGGGRRCTSSAAYSCEDLENPTGGG